MPWWRSRISAEVDEVLADAGAAVEQVGDGRVDVGDAAAVLEPVGDQLADQRQRRQRGRAARVVCQQLVERAVSAASSVCEQELAAASR